jgi:hypothetical protein
MCSFTGSITNTAPGQLRHVLDAAEVALELAALALEHQRLLLRDLLVGAVLAHALDAAELVDRLPHGRPVGQRAAEPAAAHVVLTGALGLGAITSDACFLVPTNSTGLPSAVTGG